ncbi:hypothetical protein L249_7649 [Ophiocordyceps polyrhachis-furcata BCC 54312]|uniref:Mitochondrial inner membrane protein OXA1 n=1 Tax=Ophiocordyceps polyrhachis-furcata BCC 54312 TaxID=1330021 RepID=A0A367LAC8_9HYPO|nr:hypothetical protein L249_7649 [Ophiocordyceps polyrhachis-furcata BCC 54312]
MPGWPSSIPGWSSMPGWSSVFGKEKPSPPAEPPPQPSPAIEPPPPPPPPPPDPLPPASEASDVPILPDALTAQDILGMPETPGFLHAIGLDYGWGPTSVMQWALENVHVYTGLGWAGSIVATAVLLRLTMLYPQYRALRFGDVLNRMKADPRTAEAVKLGQEGARLKNLEMQQRSRALYKLLQKEYGFSGKGVGWSVIQIPFGYGLFRVVNGMAHIPVPSLETAGWLWFPDLAARDPYFILPALASGLMISSVLINSKYSSASQFKNMKPVMYIMGSVGLVVTTFLSSAVNLMGATMGAGTLLTSVFFNLASVRRLLKLPPTTTTTATTPKRNITYEAPRPATFRRRVTDSLNDVRKGFADQITSLTGSASASPSAEDSARNQRRAMLRKAEEARTRLREEEFQRKWKGGASSKS